MKHKLIFTIIAAALCILLPACAQRQPGERRGGDPVEPSPSSAPDQRALTVPADEAPLPVSHPRPGVSEAEAAEMARAMAAAAQLYCDKYGEQAELITKNGFLYDFPAKEYMTSYFLTEGGEMDERYADEPPFILYVRPEDMQGVTGLTAPPAADGKPVIFAACEANNAFAVATARENCGLMSKEDMNALLAKYNSSHGEVRRYGAESETYRGVEKAVAERRADGARLDMRFLAADDKYAFVVCSPAGSTTNISAYALQKENDGWAVKLAEFEKEYQFRKHVTENIPDMSTALMPEFDLYFQLKYAKSNFDGVISALETEGFITEDDGAVSFISGTNDFVYAVYESGKKFVGRLTEGDDNGEGGAHWDIRPVLSYADAESYMKAHDVSPPLFIVRQE